MTHFLKKEELRRRSALGCTRACVTVKRDGDRLVVQEGIGFVEYDAVFAELPSRISVVDKDGEEIKATGRFLVSTETFDPFHVLVDMF